MRKTKKEIKREKGAKREAEKEVEREAEIGKVGIREEQNQGITAQTLIIIDIDLAQGLITEMKVMILEYTEEAKK